MNIKTFMITFLGFPFFVFANNDLETTVRSGLVLGPDSNKDYSFGIDKEVSHETSLALDYYYSKTTNSNHAFYLSSDHELNDTQSISGSLVYSKDSDNLVGKGINVGTDYTLSDHWDAELMTYLSAELGIINYSKEEQVLATTEKTNYEQLKAGLELEQELSDFLSVFAGYKHYFYNDHSEIISSTGKKKTSSTSFSSTDDSLKNKYTLGVRSQLNEKTSLTYRFEESFFRDSDKQKEQDINIRYKIKNMTLGFSYQYIKATNETAEHWWGPKISYKF